MTHPHEEMLRSLYDAFAQGAIPTVLSRFSDAITFQIPGQSQVAGTYAGKDKVLAYFGELMNLTGGTFSVEVLDVLANDHHGTVLTIERAQVNGLTLENHAVHVWDLHDGMCLHFTGYNDETWDPFWAGIAA